MVGMFFCASLGSCENDLEQVQTVTVIDETPDEVVNDMHTLYSDSGIVQIEIIATRVEKYNDKNLTVFKDGFEMNFYKGKDVVEAHLEAEYGEMRMDEKLVVARNNVIFTNYIEGQTLKTEELFWLQNAKRINTTKQFEVTSEDYKAIGVGLDADETFSDYKMHKVTVEYNL